MRRIALISCSKSKQNYPCPARELYAPSQLFSLSYQYAKKVADEVYVLSARYGLLAEEDVVAPYDLTLTDLPEHRQRDWANYVLRQMGERFDLNRDVFVILAGRISCRTLFIPLCLWGICVSARGSPSWNRSWRG